jgi:hypothetical protein
MFLLNRQVVVWSYSAGTIAIPKVYTARELRTLDDDLPAGFLDDTNELRPVRYCGAFEPGTRVVDVVDLGVNNRVTCSIGRLRVTTVKWAISR